MDSKSFRRFVKEGFETLLTKHGFRRKRPLVFEREEAGVRQVISFLLDRRRFVPRLAIVLVPFYDRGELGVVLTQDLPALEGRDPSAWWRLPLIDGSEATTATEVAGSLERNGLSWLNRHRKLGELVEELEAHKHRDEDADAEIAVAMTRLSDAGIRALIDGIGQVGSAPSANRPSLKPEVVKCLSYCYELQGDWRKALDAWRDYCEIFPPGDTSEFLRQVGERLKYLTERVQTPR